MASYNKNVKAVFNNRVGQELLLQLKERFIYPTTDNLDISSLSYNAGQRDLVLELFHDAKVDLTNELPNVNNDDDGDL